MMRTPILEWVRASWRVRHADRAYVLRQRALKPEQRGKLHLAMRKNDHC
jgi:hypothetical protein